VLFSAGCTLLALAGFYQIIDVYRLQTWAWPLIIAGRNPILLYTLACVYRWWILKAWHLVLGPGLFKLATAPVIESVLVAVTLWAVAVVLDRLRIYIRI
jgi:predicted acyltransferase